MKVVVIGAGPAGVVAAVRAAELGADTTLLARDRFGGMAAHDGPVPVRTLAYAAKLVRGARQLETYGIAAREPLLSYPALLSRVRDVVSAAADQSTLHRQANEAGVEIREGAGRARLVDARTVAPEHGAPIHADRIILCTGGVSRRLRVPGSELTATHSDAWALTEVPPSLLVIGGGMTGLQVASIFAAFGSRVRLFQSGPRILSGADEDVSAAVASGLRASGIEVHEGFGTIDAFERTADGVRMATSREGTRAYVEAALAVVAVGWVADTESLDLASGGVECDAKGFVKTDRFLCTSVPSVFAAGDITGRFMIVPPAVHDGYAAATNAILGPTVPREEGLVPIAGFTEPEYGGVGMTEREARQGHDVAVGTVRFDETTRTIVDGRTNGFCKLIADRKTHAILGCHVVGERAADIVQAVAIAIAGRLTVEALAQVPLAYPTYVGMLTRAAFRAARQIDPGSVATLHGAEG